MHSGDFILFDDGEVRSPEEASHNAASTSVDYARPEFRQYRGAATAGSPLLDSGLNAPISSETPRGAVHDRFSPQEMSPSAYSPHVGESLGSPLNMLSLQAGDSVPGLFPALFPNTQPLGGDVSTVAPQAPQMPVQGMVPGANNLSRWKAFWDAEQQRLRDSMPPRDTVQYPLSGVSDPNKATVSPKDLHLETNIPPPSRPLFPPRAGSDDSSIPPTPFTGTSSMETGSSTEEDDDEDEKPFPVQGGAVPSVPNEQALAQWNRSMYSMPNVRGAPTGPWTRFGPSFAGVSTSSESDEGYESATPSHIPDNHARQSIDTESLGPSAGSMTESEFSQDDRGHASPSIRGSAEAITTAAEQPRSPSPSSEREISTPPAQTRKESPRTTYDTLEQDSSSPDAAAESDPAAEDSDYDQHEAGPVRPTARSRRARHSRGASGSYRGRSADSRGRSADSRARDTARTPPAGVIRCDYVSPVTHIPCGTVFHRMYDLARHRITLHLREEAQLVKEGRLSVEDSVVLGKEVDVKKALSELEWACRVCGAVFSRKDAMLRHERLRHQ